MIQLQNWKQNRFGHLVIDAWNLFGICLPAGRQGICDLGFLTLCPLLYALCSF
jgi:hypothetical protein